MIRPPFPPADPPLSPPAARAALSAAGVPDTDGTALVLVDAAGRIAYASAEGLALFGAASLPELEARLTAGEGPAARRLRHLAASAPIGSTARLERLRISIGRRAVARNFACARIAAPDGRTLLALWTPGAAAPATSATVSEETPSSASPGPRPAAAAARSRFVWSLDEAGRFGDIDAALLAALGAHAPRLSESLSEAGARADSGATAPFVEAVARRETFADLALAWPAADDGFVARLSLSGTPVFGRSREFRGFRGFGVLKAIEPALANAAASESASESAPVSADPAPPAVPAPAEDGESDENASAALPPEDAKAAPAPVPPAEARPERPAEEAAPESRPERTAAIYVLRQTAFAPVKVAPIRPLPPDAPAAGSQLSEPVELSTSEREAFREIARALVGRAPPTRRDVATSGEPVKRDPDGDAPAPAAVQPEAPDADAGNPVRRNAAALLDRLPVGVAVVREGRALYVNQTLLALLGHADFEAFDAAGGFPAMFGGDDDPTIPPEAGGVLTITRADGETLAADGHAQAILWDGAPATLIALRRSGEAEIRERLGALERGLTRNGSATELQEMLDRATDGAVTLDSSGRILSLNASAERLFGYAEKDVAGESVLMLLAPQSHPETTARLDALSRVENEPSVRPLPVTGRRRDGSALALALTLARIGPSDALHYCALVRDLSETREGERRLAAARDAAFAASSAKTEYLAQVSHEVRTPLNAILGFAEVMLEERFGPIGNERYRDYLKDIHTSARHVMSLADDLLDLAKIEAGKLELEFTSVDANSVIRECVSLMQPQAARERIIMRVSLLDQLPPVMVDERSLRQILLNLMSNAVKFNEPGGQVIVSTALDAAGQAVIRVRDTGVGMNESEIGHALEPFGQVNRRGKPGAGLGLPLTKALVEANKAEFSIQSRRDHGTLIEIAFPVAQAAQ